MCVTEELGWWDEKEVGGDDETWEKMQANTGLHQGSISGRRSRIGCLFLFFFYSAEWTSLPSWKALPALSITASNFQVSSRLLSPPLADLKSISGGWRGQKTLKISLIAAAVGCTFWSSPRQKNQNGTDLQLQGGDTMGASAWAAPPPHTPRSGAFHNSVAARRERRSPRQVNNQPTQSAVCDRFHANKAFSYSLRRGSTRRGLSRCSLLITINL